MEPADLIAVGYITGAYGLQGWVRVKNYSAAADALLYAKTWWLVSPSALPSSALSENTPQETDVLQVKLHSGEIVARFVGVADRDAAEARKGTAVHIRRAHFPPLGSDEFYWVDLIGCAVNNLAGESLGVVQDLMGNGAHPILRVEDAASGEILIPFVASIVQTVDLPTKNVIVDWQRDY